MSYLAPGVLLLPVLSGGLLVHLLWPERKLSLLIFKAFLGIGVGLGLSSLLYFLYMLFFAGQHGFTIIQVLLFLGLAAATVWIERQRGGISLPPLKLTRTQAVFLGLAALVFVISLLSITSYLLRRKQGDWDAWMMFNRSALFIYRDPAHWLSSSFSRQMDPIFHPDYPLLLAMNTAWGWDVAGSETPHVPMMQSALFSIACVGLLAGALASSKSVGQACLGLIVLWGTPTLVNEGAREMADLPLAFFMLATIVLIYFYVVQRSWGLIVLAGLTAGIAAWTKNEGSLFVVAVGIGLLIAFFRQQPVKGIAGYAAGAAFPFAMALYLKVFLAPPSDVLSNSTTNKIQQILELPRHLEILQFYGRALLDFGGWTRLLGILPILLVYFLLFRLPIQQDLRPAYVAGISIVAIQLLGDYGVYLITPYDLTWHLTYSVGRIFLQIYPLLLFLILCAVRTPESIFSPAAKN